MLTTLLTLEEAGERLSTTDRHVRTLVEKGLLHHYRLGEKFIRLSAEDIDLFLREHHYEAWSRGSDGHFGRPHFG